MTTSITPIRVAPPTTLAEMRWYKYPKYAPIGYMDTNMVVVRWKEGLEHVEEFGFSVYYDPDYADNDKTSCWRLVEEWCYLRPLLRLIPHQEDESHRGVK